MPLPPPRAPTPRRIPSSPPEASTPHALPRHRPRNPQDRPRLRGRPRGRHSARRALSSRPRKALGGPCRHSQGAQDHRRGSRASPQHGRDLRAKGGGGRGVRGPHPQRVRAASPPRRRAAHQLRGRVDDRALQAQGGPQERAHRLEGCDHHPAGLLWTASCPRPAPPPRSHEPVEVHLRLRRERVFRMAEPGRRKGRAGCDGGPPRRGAGRAHAHPRERADGRGRARLRPGVPFRRGVDPRAGQAGRGPSPPARPGDPDRVGAKGEAGLPRALLGDGEGLLVPHLPGRRRSLHAPVLLVDPEAAGPRRGQGFRGASPGNGTTSRVSRR